MAERDDINKHSFKNICYRNFKRIVKNHDTNIHGLSEIIKSENFPLIFIKLSC